MSRRPYFYFRRNGRVIPAGGRGGGSNRGRGGSTAQDMNLNSTFLRPEHYAAPEGGTEPMKINVESTPECPGWQLYFRTEYQPESEAVGHIKLLTTHYRSHLVYYDLAAIRRWGWFILKAKVITDDEVVMQGWPTMVEDMRLNPMRTMAKLGLAMHTLISSDPLKEEASNIDCYSVRSTHLRKIYVRPLGFLAADALENVSSTQLDNLFCVRGVAVAVRAAVAVAAWIAYKCSRCRQEQALKQMGDRVSRPNSCQRPGCLEKKGFVEQRSSPHTRIAAVQIICVADTHLQASLRETVQPERIDVELRHDLVDSAVPGQEVIVTGVLRMRPLMKDLGGSKTRTCTNEIFLKAVAVSDASAAEHVFMERDVAAVSAINSEPDSFKLLVHSIAPELHGQELVKAGVLLSLLGGAGSQLNDANEELSVLLVGDPGIGKSRLLQMCSLIAPRGVWFSGRSGTTTGNQFAAAISTKNLCIDAGAASTGGHCSIDDLDHATSQQGTTLLQTMQSKYMQLALTSAFATLSARASIIASANSSRGHYDQSRLLTENVRISPALVGEFDLVYLLLDRPNRQVDTSLTEHLWAVQDGNKKSASIAARFAMKIKSNNSVSISESVEADDDVVDGHYDLSGRLRLNFNGIEDEELDLLPSILLRKFIVYARQQVKPLLNDEAIQAVRRFYMDLRAQSADDKLSAVSTSQLETLVRLTQARARLDFAAAATPLHVRDVIAVMRHSLADAAVGDYVDTNPATATGAVVGQRGGTAKFVQMLQMRSSVLSRRLFDYDELRDIARRAGISHGVGELVEAANFQGHLLKKGPNLYEVMPD